MRGRTPPVCSGQRMLLSKTGRLVYGVQNRNKDMEALDVPMSESDRRQD